eukprot:323056_1
MHHVMDCIPHLSTKETIRVIHDTQWSGRSGTNLILKFLSYRDAFETFANQLIREFSVENLLFLLEMTQIKAKIVNAELLCATHVGFDLEFDKKVMYVQRESSVIRSMDDALKQIQFIVDHYIDHDGAYTINIVSTLRQQILIATDLIRDDDKECTSQILQQIKDKRYGDLRAHKRMQRMRAVTAPAMYGKGKERVRGDSRGLEQDLATELEAQKQNGEFDRINTSSVRDDTGAKAT